MLRAVAPGERPLSKTRRRPRTLRAAVELDERDLLVALRKNLAVRVDEGVPAHALAGLIKQIRDLDKEVRLLDARQAQEQEMVQSARERGDRIFDASVV